MSNTCARRNLTGLAAVLCCALFATGCAQVNPQQGNQSSSSPATTAAAVPSVNSHLPGVSTTQINRDDPALPMHVVWPVVAGMPALNTLVSDAAHHVTQAFESEHSPDSQEPPELQVTGTLVLDAAGIVGIRLQVYEAVGQDTANRVRTFFGSRSSSTAWTGPDLVGASARTSMVPLFVKTASAGGHDPANNASSNSNQEAVLGGLTFDTAGGLVATPDQGSILAPGEGLVPLSLGAVASTPLLSAQGLEVQRAARQSAPHAPGSSASGPASTPPGDASAPAHPTVNCAKKKCVALTFDDGPGPYTETLLNELDKAGVKATFFQIGTQAKQYPQVIARQVRDGMVIGNHTYDHRNLAVMSRADQEAEVRDADHWITAGGAPKTTLLRPPYGSYNHQTRTLGKAIILWNVDSEDWKNRNSAMTTALIMKEVRPGSIVLMHDIHPTTVAAIPGIIKKLRALHYTFVTVPELLGHPTPGKAYFDR